MSERNEARVRALLTTAADAAVPGDRLSAILERTAADELAARRRRRRGWFAVGSTAVATAAAVTAFAMLGQGDPVTGPGPAAPSQTQEPTPSDPPTGEPTSQAIPVYFAGETPVGLRLYREFHPALGGIGRVAEAAASAVEGRPLDSDYRSLWPAHAAVDARVVEVDGEVDFIDVSVDPSVRERPKGMTDEEAALALQQVIYTVQGVVGERAPVWFKIDGLPTAEVLGVPTSEPLANGPVLDTLAHVNITTPTEGQEVSGDVLDVSGVGNSYEANLLWQLQAAEGADVVAEGFFTLQGAMEPRLFPFEGTVDLSGVPPGRYLLTVSTEDASGGAEGPGPYTDTRVIEVE